ncbi:LysR family transcriptional regulator [Paracoccus sp. YLB-12]|uniref:LysR family transcriptional regulator n=1 Tax=Paracoccus maritimus TaxID=2933292 RepID=A0ABT2K9D1_9RHOB|nr:LysR family transcriptional regulator [Paracoccus sp. YLB-12]MCT4333143.1 LysR family transcriptional regulator [Paracoccus sp. YLB-12]
MNLRRLETLYWAVRLGSFKATAEKLNSTQSTVSMRIQELERELGVTLFDRSPGMVRPTEIGRDLIPYVEQVLRSAAEMNDRLAETGMNSGRIRIGVAEVVSMSWLPQLVAALRVRYPRVQVEIEEALTRQLEQGLESGRLDLVLAPGGNQNGRYLVRDLGAVEFAWMSGPSLCCPDTVYTPSDLAEMPMISLAEESYHTISITEWFNNHPRTANAGTCQSMGVAASLAISGLGITLLPVKCYDEALARGHLIRLRTSTAFPLIPFRAMVAPPTTGRLALNVAELAAEISTFLNTAEE